MYQRQRQGVLVRRRFAGMMPAAAYPLYCRHLVQTKVIKQRSGLWAVTYPTHARSRNGPDMETHFRYTSRG